MPGFLKIGLTTRTIEERIRELEGTGVPMRFQLEEFFISPQIAEHERLVHAGLSMWRVSGDREFFKIDLATARKMISQILKIQPSLCPEGLRRMKCHYCAVEIVLRAEEKIPGQCPKCRSGGDGVIVFKEA